MDIREAIARAIEGQDLAEAEAESVMGQIMRGEATPAQIGAFLTALRMKGETTLEIAGSARAMRASATPVKPERQDLVDTCGTGGDNLGTFNISTTAAFVVVGAGLGVAKHGNRSVSSRAGSADTWEALGMRLELTPEEVAHCIDSGGSGFLSAPILHPAMRHAIGPRREMGVRTIFNILGPLTNPALVPAQVIGVYQPELTQPMAEVLGRLGTREAIVFYGGGGLDELSTLGPNRISHLKDGQVETYVLDGEDLGLPRAELAELLGGTPQENAALTEAVLAGEKGPRRDVVVLNAGAALMVGGVARDFREGLERAQASIDSGQALARLNELREIVRKR